LASQLFPEESAELLAMVGAEMLRGKHEAEAQQLANLAQQAAGNIPRPAADPKAVRPAPSSLIALWLALGKADKAAALLPQGANNEQPEIGILLGQVEGAARRGEWEAARARARTAATPLDRLAALVAIASVAVENDASVARADMEEAVNLAEGELKGKPVSPWLLWKLVRAAAATGLSDRAQNVTRLIPDPAFRGWAQLEVVRQRLADSKEKADETLVQSVDKDSFAQGVAQELVARQNARVAGSSAQKQVESVEPEKLRPFGYLGVALGLRDREQ
jgi:hypothetical protein